MSDETNMDTGTVAEDHRADVDRLKHHVGEMSDFSVHMVKDGARALIDNDATLAKTVTDRDTRLDKYDIDLETETMRLMAITQPEASDLRTLGAVLKIGNCLDRVGRLGYDLARMVTTAGPTPKDQTHQQLLRQMDVQVRAMVEKSTHAFLTSNASEAKEVFAMDDDVDALNLEVNKVLVALLQKGGLTVERLANALLAARHLERVGDNACKVAEKAIYAITGERRTEYFPQLAHKTSMGRIIP
jgi:phosphate transport system protein